MEDQYIPPREVWEFEAFLATKLRVWRVEAINLRYSAEALLLYDKEVFNDATPRPLPGFFSARVERMLFGFALENLVKASLLQDLEKAREVFGRDGKLTWGRDGHDLLKLFDEANVETSKLEKTFLELWQLCALWAGRYPIPVKEKHLPRQRRGLRSQAALLKRAQKRIKKATAERDLLLGVDISDLMYGGVGWLEEECFRDLFGRCEALLPD